MSSIDPIFTATFGENATYEDTWTDPEHGGEITYPASSNSVSGAQSSGVTVTDNSSGQNFTIFSNINEPPPTTFGTSGSGGVGIDWVCRNSKGIQLFLKSGDTSNNHYFKFFKHPLSNDMKIQASSGLFTSTASSTITLSGGLQDDDIVSLHIFNDDSKVKFDMFRTRGSTTTHIVGWAPIIKSGSPIENPLDLTTSSGSHVESCFQFGSTNQTTIRLEYLNHSASYPHPKYLSYYHLPASGDNVINNYDSGNGNAPGWNHPGAATAPTMTITSSTVDSGDTSSDTSIALTFTSSGNTTDFTESDITVSGGVISNFSGSATTYTATFAPTSAGTTTISVGASTFTSSSLNNTASNTFTWTYTDGTPPVITIAAGYGEADIYVLNGITTTSTANFAVTLAQTETNKYQEQGATALDAIDVDRTVTIGGDTVNTTTLGTYTVTYTASDTSGNIKVLSKTVTVTSSHDTLKNVVLFRNNNIRSTFNSVCRAYMSFTPSGLQLKTVNEDVGFSLTSTGDVGFGISNPEEFFQTENCVVDENIALVQLTSLSDRTLKENITDITVDESRLLHTLDMMQYNWKSKPDEPIHYGIIAQDLIEKYPDLVKEIEGIYTIDYIGLIPLIVNELKHQIKEVDKLTEEIGYLENVLEKKLNRSNENTD